jgi:uncharacterized protein
MNTSQQSASRRALVVRGGWDGHFPVEATNLFIPFLETHGFQVRVEESPAVYADADELAATDLIVQTNTMSTIEDDQLKGLIAAVTNGTGLGGWHGGLLDSYRNSSDYLHFVGGQFASHPGKLAPERHGGQEDNYIPYTVNMLPAAATHPITVGLSDFELTTEQYWLLHDDYNDVLATTTQEARPEDPWTRPVTSPAIFTRQWGKGRIFATTVGHNLDVLTNPTVTTIIERGLLWAAR